MAYCDKFPLDDMPEDAVNLMHLLYSMVMVSFPVECWGQGPSARHRRRLPRPAGRARSLNQDGVLEPGLASLTGSAPVSAGALSWRTRAR